MRRLIGGIAWVGFGVSLFTHVLTYFGVDLSRYVPFVWLLHIGIFPLIILFGFTSGGFWKSRKEFWTRFNALIPNWATRLVQGLFAYALLNFALFFYLSQGGTPEIRDGRYVLSNHGQIIRELSEDENSWQRAYMLRGFSGHWMLFYALPTVYFWYPRPLVVDPN